MTLSGATGQGVREVLRLVLDKVRADRARKAAPDLPVETGYAPERTS